MTMAWHSSQLPDGSDGGSPGGFLLKTVDGTIYFACDTALFSDMKLIAGGGVDLAVLPIGDLFTMGPEDSIEAIKLINPDPRAAQPLQHLAADPAGCRRPGRKWSASKRRPNRLCWNPAGRFRCRAFGSRLRYGVTRTWISVPDHTHVETVDFEAAVVAPGPVVDAESPVVPGTGHNAVLEIALGQRRAIMCGQKSSMA